MDQQATDNHEWAWCEVLSEEIHQDLKSSLPCKRLD